jgi:hypothetical protein
MTTSLSEIDVRAVTLLWSVRVVTKKKKKKKIKMRRKSLIAAERELGKEKVNLQVSFPL